jgi:Trk K+ transport system NAD-binding subunit
MTENKSSSLEVIEVSDHTIICNWSEKIDSLIEELHNPSLGEKRDPIIIISKNPIYSSKIFSVSPDKEPSTEEKPSGEKESIDDDNFKGILVIEGDPAEKTALKKANINSAKRIIILADRSLGDAADSKTIITALAIDRLRPEIHTVAEVLFKDNRSYFKEYTLVNEIVCLELFENRLLAQSCLTKGISEIYQDLVTQSKETNEIYREKIPASYHGKFYQELKKVIFSLDDIILIGYASKNTKETDKGDDAQKWKSNINPSLESSRNYIMKKDDEIFLIAHNWYEGKLKELLK